MLVVCTNVKCSSLNKRYYEQTKFCQECGTKTEEIKMCCTEEGIGDIGFCTKCGTEKKVMMKGEHECQHCEQIVQEKEMKTFEDSFGNDQEACVKCFDNWNDSDDNDEDQYRGDR